MMSTSLRNLTSALIVAAIVIAGLVLGRAVLIPLTIAIILAFILNPIVRSITRLGVPRALAVSMSVVSVVVLLVGGLIMISGQLLNLTSELNQYRTNVAEKVRVIAESSKENATLAKASKTIKDLETAIKEEIESTDDNEAANAPFNPSKTPSNTASGASAGNAQDKPAEEKAKAGQTAESSTIRDALPMLTTVLVQAGISLLFTIFLMMQYTDLRDRVVRIVGTDHMSDTTSAMSEAGSRLSKVFLAQAIMNSAFGVFVGLALWAIGVPNPALWGVLAALMRFVPYVGSFISVLPPLFVAAAVDPGWSMVLMTLAVFAIGEPVMGHVVEPTVLGKRAGVSPFAMVASASFWTIIWGPIGLILAAPLTMTLVVLGRYIKGLEFFSVLLGDQPALSPQQVFYHRLLSADSISAITRLETQIDNSDLVKATDELVLPALQMANYDDRLSRLDAGQKQNITSAMAELSRSLDVIDEETDTDRTEDARPHIIVIGARSNIDIVAAAFVADVMKSKDMFEATALTGSAGMTALSSAIDSASEDEAAGLVIVSAASIDPQQMRFIGKKASRDFPNLKVVLLDFTVKQRPRSHAEIALPDGVTVVRSLAEAFVQLEHLGKTETVDDAAKRVDAMVETTSDTRDSDTAPGVKTKLALP